MAQHLNKTQLSNAFRSMMQVMKVCYKTESQQLPIIDILDGIATAMTLQSGETIQDGPAIPQAANAAGKNKVENGK